MSKLKKITKKVIPFLKPFLCNIFEFEAWLASQWSKSAHKRLFFIQWSLPPSPEFFDHSINLNFLWLETRASFWLERGAFGLLALKRGGEVLELACGDGFNARNFYSGVAGNILACDFDPKAIKLAKKKNSAPNLSFVVADIRNNMPKGKFDNICWDAAIEHFTPNEIKNILSEIKNRWPCRINNAFCIGLF